MNILGLVFSIFFILSYGFYAIRDQRKVSDQLETAYLSHQKAQRVLLNKLESSFYNDNWQGVPKKSSSQKPSNQSKEKSKDKKKDPEINPNPECSRINLWPLVQEGREAHPLLYELAVKLIHTSYRSFYERGSEQEFLNALLASIKKGLQEEKSFSLEKVVFSDPTFQRIYYKMLKGTREWNLQEKVGYPPLLEYVKLEQSNDKICLHHAHPDLITLLFNAAFAKRFFEKLQGQDPPPPITPEFIQQIASEVHMLNIDPALFSQFDLYGYLKHGERERKKTFVADVKDVHLRKHFPVPRS